MTSLYNRATPAQERILRIVEGAVLNAADAHGEERDIWLARSIAKRAAGTLSAQWPEVLAVSSRLPANGAVGTKGCRACERRAHLARLKARRQRSTNRLGAAERRASQVLRRPPLRELWERLKRKMWSISRSGDAARIEAYRDLLRMIDRLERDIEAAKMI